MQISVRLTFKGIATTILFVAMAVLFVQFGTSDIILSTAQNHTDQYYYMMEYNDGLVALNQFGLYLWELICIRLGLDYNGFKIVVAITCIYLIWKRIGKVNINYFFLLLLYFFSAYMSDLEQMRSFIGTSIVLYGTKFLQDNNRGLKGYVLYFITVLIATSFHSSMVFFIFFLLIPFIKDGRAFDLFYFVSATVCLLVFMFPGVIETMGSIVYLLTKNDRVAMWFTLSNGLSFFACLILHGMMLLMLSRLLREIHRLNRETFFSDYDKEVNLCEFAYRMMQVLSLAFPMYLMSSEFIRLFRCLFIFFFFVVIYISTTIDYERGTRDKRRLYGIALIIFVIGYMYVFKAHRIIMDYYQLL